MSSDFRFPSSAFDLLAEAVLAVNADGVAYMNAPARALFPDLDVGGDADGVFPAELTENLLRDGSKRVVSICSTRSGTASVTGERFGEYALFVVVPRSQSDESLQILQNVVSVTQDALHTLNFAAGHVQSYIEEGEPLKDPAEEMSIIRRSCYLLIRCSKHLANYAALTKGETVRGTEVVDFAALCQHAADTLEILTGMDVKLDCQLPYAPIPGSFGQLETMVLNLLSNSVQHTPEGGRIRMTLSARGDRLTLTVRDSGTGMDDETMASAFDPSLRPESEQLIPHGLGLGLSIAAETARLYGGALIVTSGDDGGTVAALTLHGRLTGDTVCNIATRYGSRGIHSVLTEMAPVLHRSCYRWKYFD